MPSASSCTSSIYSRTSSALLALFTLISVCPALSSNLEQKPGKPAQATKGDQAQSNKYRLPKFALPLEYELSFEPDLSKFSFSGTESVRIQVQQPTSEIVLNAVNLKVSCAEISALLNEAADKVSSKARTQGLEVRLEPETEKLRFVAKEALVPGTYMLTCKFDGVLNNELRGFYRAAYEDDAHKKHWLAATQMEATDARRMFPCFDEPAYKAVFRIKAKVKKDQVAISNAPVEQELLDASDKKTVIFEPSPRMSSYLLALIVGDLKCSGETHGASVPIKVWAVAGKEQLGKYALSEAGKILDCEAKYFGLPYLGKKLDLIALPEFSAGAMENIGAITFNDTSLLTDEKTGSSSRRQDITGTMAHEMAHQWFGDLVTMDWWDDLWLNEAFASWMSTKVLDILHPEWRDMTESVLSRNYSMSTDALKSTRPIHAAVNNPAQAVEMFDGITYSKGAAVLHMLESFVGVEKFQHGITKYLQEHSFGNAAAADFWNAIAAEAVGVPVAEIMKGFIYQPGYPQVNVKLAANGQELSFAQYRQFRLGQDKKDSSIWLLPLVLRGLGQESNSSTAVLNKLFSGREAKFSVKSSGQPYFVNSGGTGYFRTCYEPKQLQAIQDKFAALSAEEKLVLLSDCSSLVLPGDLPVEAIYNFVYKIKNETDPLILDALVSIVDGATQYLADSARQDLEGWIQITLSPLRTKLDAWNQKSSDSEHTKQLRKSVLRLLGTYGQDKRTIDEASVMFGNYVNDRSSVNPDLVGTVLSITAFNGGAKEYDQMMRLYKTGKNPADKEEALDELALFHQTALARRTLLIGMSSEVKRQAGIGLICSVVHNRYTRDIGWSFVKQHWAEIIKTFPPESLRALAGLVLAFDTAEREKEFSTWYASHPVPFAKSQTARSLESMHTKVLYRQRYADRIRKWVAKNS